MDRNKGNKVQSLPNDIEKPSKIGFNSNITHKDEFKLNESQFSLKNKTCDKFYIEKNNNKIVNSPIVKEKFIKK